jgi:hypothetical protein
MAKKILRTRLCDMLGIEYPILSAGMGPTLIGETTGAPVELVVAVSEAGGLGVLGGSGFTVEELRHMGLISSCRDAWQPAVWIWETLKSFHSAGYWRHYLRHIWSGSRR